MQRTSLNRLVIIIINFRTPDLVQDCLKSLRADVQASLGRVIVVDNDSGDGSVERLTATIEEQGWQEWVSVLPQKRNIGFAAGNNAALQCIFSNNYPNEFVWLLNPDTLVRKNACKYLTDFLDRHSKVGIVGSRLEDIDGTTQVSAFRHHSIVSEFLAGIRLGYLDKLFAKYVVAQKPISDTPQQTDWVAGASMMIRSEVFIQVGLLDEQYFLYFEEEDFCKKAVAAGWQCWYVPESQVVHLVGAASGFSDTRKKSPRRPSYWFESRRRYFLKNYGKLTTSVADFAWMAGYSIWRVRRFLQGKLDLDPPFFLKDFFSHSVFCKGFRL